MLILHLSQILKNKFFTFFCLILLSATAVFSQTPDFTKRIIIDIWAELDAFPESKEAADVDSDPFEYSINRIKEISPFLLNGMVYGWNFEYTPSDKLRHVSEYFEMNFINEINFQETPAIYKAPKVIGSNLHSWVEFNRTPQQIWNLNQWKSINSKKIQGRGKGKISDGLDGIINATKDAVKNAIREYYRSIIKNKPKEIDGKIIIREEPRIGIVEGQYVVDLDFFLETDRIVKYTQF